MRPDLAKQEEYYHQYIALTSEEDPTEALEANLNHVSSFYRDLTEEQGDFAYEAGKWTIKNVFQHCIDTERVFSYRALCFARGELQSLPGFDHDEFAKNAKTENRSLRDMLEEFDAVRGATIQLYYSFTPEELSKAGIGGNNRKTVNGLAYIIAGHYNHHINIIKERYLK
jgi:hypothetical protein